MKRNMSFQCLKSMSFPRFVKPFFIALAVFLALFFALPYFLLPKNTPYSFALYDKDGILLGATCASDGQWRFEPGEVPERFKIALVNFEDRRFYFHPGVDFISIGRAFISNKRAGRIVSGGSTITMQTIRLLQKSPPRTYAQKIKEAFLAVMLDARFSKKKVLELYCALAPFGGNVVGLEAASWRYFARAPKDLTWAESAALAVLPNQPSLVFPGTNDEIFLQKRNSLLARLFKKKYLSEEEYALALSEPLPQKAHPLPSGAFHYLEYLKLSSPRKNKFFSTLDSSLQQNASRIVEYWSEEFSRQGINNAACLIVRTKTGEPLAYIGNTGRERNAKNYDVNIVNARRSSGSLLKPFLFAAMLDNGMLLPQQLVLDVPTRIGNYKPENNVNTYCGALRADEALSRSLNIPAVRELREYGITQFLDYLKLCGFTTLDRSAEYYGLPLILGGGEITLYETVLAYASLMNVCSLKLSTEENFSFRGSLIRSREREVDERVSERNSKLKSAHHFCTDFNTSDVHMFNKRFPASAGAAALTLNALEKGTRPAEEALWQSYATSRKIAWKTGTSNGKRDAWAIGTTADYTIGVWIGNAEGQGSENLRSMATAAPVLFDLFSILPPSKETACVPEDALCEQTVCAASGFAAGKNCPETKIALRPSAAPLGELCPYCKIVSLTPDKKFQATVSDMKGEYEGFFPVTEKRFVLPPSIEYYYTRQALGYRHLPPFLPEHRFAQKSELSILFPEQGAQIILPIEIDGTPGKTVMQAASRSKGATLYWDLDGEFLGETRGEHTLAVRPRAGWHTLTVTDSNGTRRTRQFEIAEGGM